MLTVSLVKSVILLNFGHMAGLSGQLRMEMVVTKNWRGRSIANEIRTMNEKRQSLITERDNFYHRVR